MMRSGNRRSLSRLLDRKDAARLGCPPLALRFCGFHSVTGMQGRKRGMEQRIRVSLLTHLSCLLPRPLTFYCHGGCRSHCR